MRRRRRDGRGRHGRGGGRADRAPTRARRDEILRAAVDEVAKRLHAFCGIRFVEGGELVPGPAAGGEATAGAVVPVAYDGATVAEVVLGAPLADGDRAALERIAELLAPYCLVGWDTGGETWQA